MKSSLIAKNIKELRTKNNLSQTQLADKVFTTRSTISKWESGFQEPSLDSLRLLSDVFMVPIFVILGEKPNSIRDKTWELFGKSVFYSLFWIHLDFFFGLMILLVGTFLTFVGFSFPFLKPLSVLLVMNLKSYRVDDAEVLKIVGYILAWPLFTMFYVFLGTSLIRMSLLYVKFSSKVFWKTNTKRFDKKYKFPKINKWIWIGLGISGAIGLILISTGLGIVADTGNWRNRMW